MKLEIALISTSFVQFGGVELQIINKMLLFLVLGFLRLDKTRFHVIGAVLFTAQQGLLHPTAVVKTRMQVDGGGLSHMNGFSVFKKILKQDGVPGIFRGFGTSAIGALPGRVLALTALEVSKDIMMKYSEGSDTNEATQIAVANGVAGLVSTIISCTYFVPLDVVSMMFFLFLFVSRSNIHEPFQKQAVWFIYILESDNAVRAFLLSVLK